MLGHIDKPFPYPSSLPMRGPMLFEVEGSMSRVTLRDERIRKDKRRAIRKRANKKAKDRRDADRIVLIYLTGVMDALGLRKRIGNAGVTTTEGSH